MSSRTAPTCPLSPNATKPVSLKTYDLDFRERTPLLTCSMCACSHPTHEGCDSTPKVVGAWRSL
eukprot:2236246-Pleurochrysis_carterae.AAC.1